MSEGFVYALRNESMSGLVKIGMTIRMPTDRSGELYTTGVPTPFEVIVAIFSTRMDELEKEVHAALTTKRVSKSREFFRVEEQDAVMAIMNAYAVVCDHCVAMVDADAALSEEEVCKHARTCGVHPYELRGVIGEIAPNAWKAAASRFIEKRDNRIRMLRCSDDS